MQLFLSPQADKTLSFFLSNSWFCSLSFLSCSSLSFYSICFLFSKNSLSLIFFAYQVGSFFYSIYFLMLLQLLGHSLSSFSSMIQLALGKIFFNPFKSLGLYLIVWRSASVCDCYLASTSISPLKYLCTKGLLRSSQVSGLFFGSSFRRELITFCRSFE